MLFIVVELKVELLVLFNGILVDVDVDVDVVFVLALAVLVLIFVTILTNVTLSMHGPNAEYIEFVILYAELKHIAFLVAVATNCWVPCITVYYLRAVKFINHTLLIVTMIVDLAIDMQFARSKLKL